MPTKSILFVLTCLFCLARSGEATTLHRCEAADGSITFTSMSCSHGERLSKQEVHPYSPGSVVAVMPEANHEKTSGMNIQGREPGIVGVAEHLCGNVIDARQRREAIINRRVIAGMSAQDVESALGKPDKVNIRTSTTTYRYDLKRGRSAQVDFDQRGCVKEKGKSRTAKSPR
ncbi:cell envelope protein SmpA [Pseudomonas sp. TH08]|uniref:cell envelope protein SmpA n=1 Tax=unclassified Pseudomonas TaxID=196821 RepID=UPI0019122198|nr:MULTISPECIES: cell envelope protein SmpA [unclassified Pseudomonas]MBK5376230.1 cell envelope protein SmpA [Pseudomonas sp. TH43]MBK5533216.1 cell envelope protein SmpA [Pseudomonas sp. TH08]